MKLSVSHAVLLLAAAFYAEAAKPTTSLKNSKVVVNNSLRNTRLVSNNAFLPSDEKEEDMTPAMSRSLQARTMRGGAVSGGSMQTLKVGFYFFAWYFLNVVYNSEFNGCYFVFLWLTTNGELSFH
jgi:hypothetical protein